MTVCAKKAVIAVIAVISDSDCSLWGSTPRKLELQAKKLQATSQIDCVDKCWYQNNIRTFQLCLQLAACSLQLRAISAINSNFYLCPTFLWKTGILPRFHASCFQSITADGFTWFNRLQNSLNIFLCPQIWNVIFNGFPRLCSYTSYTSNMPNTFLWWRREMLL